MNFEQIKGIVERVATVGITWAVARGYVPSALGADVVALIVLGASVAWGFYVNTPRALDAAARNVS